MADPRTDTPPPAPRWVRAFAIAGGLLVAAFLASHLLGGGGGPMSHLAPLLGGGHGG